MKPGVARVTSTPWALAARDVDVADVDGAADEGDEVGRVLEHRGGAVRKAVGDDGVATGRRFREFPAGEVALGVVQPDLRHLAQPGERLVAVVVRARLGRVGQVDAEAAAAGAVHGSTLPGFMRFRGSIAALTARITSSATGSLWVAMAWRLDWPMPCSAEKEPPRSTATAFTSASASPARATHSPRGDAFRRRAG